MEWPLIIATFILGLVLGYVGRTILSRSGEVQGQDKLLEQTKLELSQYKQEVTDHFEEHHQHLNALTEQLNKVNKQWNEVASTLAPQSSLNPLSQPQQDSTNEQKG